MDEQFLTVLLVVVAGLAAIGYGVIRLRAGASSSSVVADMLRASQIAQDIVTAAEQLWLSGKLPQEQRYDYAYERVREIFPNLTNDQIRVLIESAVYFLKTGIQKLSSVEIDVEKNS